MNTNEMLEILLELPRYGVRNDVIAGKEVHKIFGGRDPQNHIVQEMYGAIRRLHDMGVIRAHWVKDPPPGGYHAMSITILKKDLL